MFIVGHDFLRTFANRGLLANLNRVVLFKGQDARLKAVHDQYGFCKDFEAFKDAYEDACGSQHGSLHIDLDENALLKNGTEVYAIE